MKIILLSCKYEEGFHGVEIANIIALFINFIMAISIIVKLNKLGKGVEFLGRMKSSVIAIIVLYSLCFIFIK